LRGVFCDQQIIRRLIAMPRNLCLQRK
jgi:hypothetical protein